MSVGGFRWNAILVGCKSRFLFYISRNSAIIVDNSAAIFFMLTKRDIVVFNIGGKKARLIAAIHYNRQKVYMD